MNTTTLIIARHGNTFLPDQTPVRAGARTDLDLVPSGIEQAKKLSTYIKEHDFVPDHIIAGPLKRTCQMAEHAFPGMDYSIDERLREVDYGPDEGQTEDTMLARIGQTALDDWNKNAIVPDGWHTDPDKMTQDWHAIAQETLNVRKGHKTLIVTSNGVARFAPYITGDFDEFKSKFSLKLATGALGIMTHSDEAGWVVQDWNIRP